MSDVWTLHEEQHRHYKLNGKWSIDGVRIASVTQVLDNSVGQLTGWAASQATAACEQVAVDWFGAGPALASSLLSFGELAVLQPEWPDNVRDDKADSGNAAHDYLAQRLRCRPRAVAAATSNVPYGLRVAIDDFIEQHRPVVLEDAAGTRVERIVGSRERAVAGTYDAQLSISLRSLDPTDCLNGRWGRHRVDLKQSRTVQPKHFAQLAEYERSAVDSGEESSDYLTILHITPTGTFKLYSIDVGGPEHKLALAMFDACLTIHRATPKLAKVLKETD